MKKMLAVLLCITLAVSSFVVTMAAEPEIVCTVSNTSVKMGEEFTVTVSISGYAPIASGMLELQFDQSVMEYVGSEWLIGAGIEDFDPEFMNGVFMFFPLESHDINGDIFRFTLKASSNAPQAGNFDITVIPQFRDENDEDIAQGDSATFSINISCAEHAYGDLIPEAPAKCGVEGKKAHYECAVCHKLFDTEKLAITEEQLVIPALSHTAGADWQSDADDHWKLCANGCGTIMDKAAHEGGEATCKDQAACSICGAKYGSLDASNHTNTETRGAVEATCGADGYTGDVWCKDCNTKIADGEIIPATGEHVDADGEWESDGTNHWHTCGVCGAAFDKAAHKGGEATCSAKAICSVCETEYGELDPDNHVNTEIRDAVAATEEADGYTGDTWCKDCNTKIAEGRVVPKLDHTHSMVKTEAKPATHEDDGNIEYYTCSKCGKMYNDADGTRELTEADIVLEATGHTYSDEWASDADGHWHACGCGAKAGEATHELEVRNAKEATETEKGYTGDKVCKICGYIAEKGKEIPAKETIPETGENDALILWVSLIGASGMLAAAALAITKKRRAKKKQPKKKRGEVLPRRIF